MDDVYMHTNSRQVTSPRGSRGLILFWLLSFPLALAVLVFVLGLV
jgi:hypothetical protein